MTTPIPTPGVTGVAVRNEIWRSARYNYPVDFPYTPPPLKVETPEFWEFLTKERNTITGGMNRHARINLGLCARPACPFIHTPPNTLCWYHCIDLKIRNANRYKRRYKRK